MRGGEGLDEGSRNRKERSRNRQGTGGKDVLQSTVINSGSKRKVEKMKRTLRFKL